MICFYSCMKPEGIHKSSPVTLILTEMNTAHSLTPYFSKIYFNIIFISAPKSLLSYFPFTVVLYVPCISLSLI
jgi:hypothetical protein